MELLAKCTALAVFSAMVALMIRRLNPEISFALSSLTMIVLLLACGSMADELMRAIHETQLIFDTSAEELRPMLKCLGIAVTSRAGADLCRDASQTALAATLEAVGGLCAAAVAMPMILSLMTMIGGML